MSPELINLLAAAVIILVIVGLFYFAVFLKRRNLIDEELLLATCDLIGIVSDIALTEETTREIAQAVIDTITFVKDIAAEQPIDVQQERAFAMLQGFVAVLDLEGLSDDSLRKLVSIAFTLVK